MLGSQKPLSVDDANVRSVLARPGVAQDLIDTPDDPAPSADAWAQILDRVTWLGDDGARVRGRRASFSTTARARRTSCSGGSSAHRRGR
jgi:hypothetical protein